MRSARVLCARRAPGCHCCAAAMLSLLPLLCCCYCHCCYCCYCCYCCHCCCYCWCWCCCTLVRHLTIPHMQSPKPAPTYIYTRSRYSAPAGTYGRAIRPCTSATADGGQLRAVRPGTFHRRRRGLRRRPRGGRCGAAVPPSARRTDWVAVRMWVGRLRSACWQLAGDTAEQKLGRGLISNEKLQAGKPSGREKTPEKKRTGRRVRITNLRFGSGFAPCTAPAAEARHRSCLPVCLPAA